MNLLLHFWTFDLVSLLLLAGLGLLYGFVSGWRLKMGAGLYFTGLLLIGLVQTSPLHVLGMHYLLSAHMVEHMLLLLVCAPLLVLGLPKEHSAKATASLKAVSVFFQKNPWFGWLICLVTMWFWHVPAIHDALISQPAANGNALAIPLCTLAGISVSHPWVNLLHILQPVSLVLAGICFAWPILCPRAFVPDSSANWRFIFIYGLRRLFAAGYADYVRTGGRIPNLRRTRLFWHGASAKNQLGFRPCHRPANGGPADVGAGLFYLPEWRTVFTGGLAGEGGIHPFPSPENRGGAKKSRVLNPSPYFKGRGRGWGKTHTNYDKRTQNAHYPEPRQLESRKAAKTPTPCLLAVFSGDGCGISGLGAAGWLDNQRSWYRDTDNFSDWLDKRTTT